jgi:hypothetical protein
MVLLCLCGMIYAQTGHLAGRVTDASSTLPMGNVNVIIQELEQGAFTNDKGEYYLTNVPVGSYTLRFQRIGYKPAVQTDVIIRSSRTTSQNMQLQRQMIEIAGVSNTIEYFAATEEEKTSVINFSHEEIRRAPGAAGDVSRIMLSLPSVAQVNDQSNNLIVRGGNPMENAFIIDNIEVPNINHFPHQGSSGGPIGILNVDFIEDVTFSTGGFSAQYGDKLSSIMQIDFRDANQREFDGQLDFNWAGFGGILEGPLSKKCSAMLAVKRSYLQYVIDTFDTGSSSAPSYGDAQVKILYQFSPLQKLSFLGILADDHNAPDQENAMDNAMSHFGNQDLYQGTGGVNWKAVWNAQLHSNTSLAYTYNDYDEDFYETYTGDYAIQNRTLEQEYKLRNSNHATLRDNLSLDFGGELKHLYHSYDNWLAETTNATGDTIPALSMNKDVQGTKVGGFISCDYSPLQYISLTAGLRADYFSYNDELNIAPRLSCKWQLSDFTTFNASWGTYYQSLPLLLLAQNSANDELRNPRAIHYIIGMEHLLSADTRLVIEAYQKEYARFPMDESQPGLFILDDDFFNNYETLSDEGRALSRGVEFLVQKKLAKNIYGLASATWFRSSYKGLDGTWRDRNYDNQLIVSAEGGYKPTPGWELSLRWIYAGGVPYTPLDVEKSMQNHYGVLDAEQINSQRYPDYHSLNLRVDRRWFFAKTNLVFYASVWNAYGQKNIAEYYWNDEAQKIDEAYQWTFLPIVGVEWEF